MEEKKITSCEEALGYILRVYEIYELKCMVTSPEKAKKWIAAKLFQCWDKIDSSETKYGSFISQEISDRKKGCICYILISTAPSKEYSVYNDLIKLREIIELHPLLGWYDIILKIKIADSKKLGNFVLNKIRKIKGITDTRTLTGSFSLAGN